MLPLGIEETRLVTPKALYVAIHDVHPGSLHRVEKIRKALAGVGVHCLTLLVVPWYHGKLRMTKDSRVTAYLHERVSLGDEVAMHGVTHSWDERLGAGMRGLFRRWLEKLLTDYEGECLGMDEKTLLDHLKYGLSMFENVGLLPNGFVAPGWMLAKKHWAVVKRAGFRHLATFSWLIDLHRGRALRSRVISGSVRTPLRRGLALPYVRLGVKLQRSPVLRVEFHPGDVDNQGYFHGVLRVLERQVCLPQVTLQSFLPSQPGI